MSRARHSRHNRQRGAALLFTLVLIAIVVVGSSVAFFGGINSSSIERDERTDKALQQAKAALIGYSVSYRDTHPNASNDYVEGFGYLPCPDIDNDGDTESNCGSGGQTMIGRLPWKTLGLPDLRATGGECLWYVVSGSHKNNPKMVPMNWDTRANIRIANLAGTVLIDGTPPAEDASGGAVAVIVAPGPPLAGQNRPSGTGVCGGDSSNNHGAYLDGAYATATAGPLTVTAGAPDSAINNDRIAWITAAELFGPVARRKDLLGDLVMQLAMCLDSTTPSSIPATFKTLEGDKWVATALGIDQVRAARGGACAFPSPSLLANTWANWKDHFHYAVCDNTASNCLTVNTASCSGALLFAGRMSTGFPRTSAQKTDASLTPYFEPPNANALTTSAPVFKGASAYSGTTPTQDIAICLTP